MIIPANGNIFRSRTRIFAVRQGRLGRRVLVAVRKAKPDAALRQKDRAGAENVSVRGYSIGEAFTSRMYPGVFVPFKIRMAWGEVRKHNLALKKDANPNTV